jgi:hypothetical protein
LLTGAACSGAKLEPVQGEGPAPVDNKLALAGEICTQNPTDELFPVKVMLLVDTSNSLQFTDQSAQRVTAVQALLDRYRGNPAVKFSVIAFDAVVSDLTGGFTSNPDISTISTRLANADRLTDYQGALGSAYATLTQDMRQSSPAELARSKYVIIFFSDGAPDPQCFADQPPVFQFVCVVDRDDWPNDFTLPQGTNPNTGSAWTWDDFQGLYPELEAGKDYNTEPQILAKVRDIIDLQEIYNVNEIRFHTGFLFDPNTLAAAIAAFNLDRDAGIQLLSNMAEVGNGTFTEFTSGAEISFLNINYTSVKQSYALTNLIVENLSAPPEKEGIVPDSDADGLPDWIEDELRLCAYDQGGANCNPGSGNLRDPEDSDGDGYTDLFEYRYRSSGFDPKTDTDFAANCTQTDDSDGDGLRDCEELFIGSDSRLMDTDGDRIPDGIEFRFGLDPTNRDDALDDNDADGTRNREEILLHWTPLAKEPVEQLPPKYKTEIEVLPAAPDGRSCYRYRIDNIDLVTTRAAHPRDRGRNRLKIHFLEGPPDDPRDFGTARVACVDAIYIAPDLKLPADGFIEIRESDFYPLTDPGIECVPPEGHTEDEEEAADPSGG